jgi:hypothetical protein
MFGLSHNPRVCAIILTLLSAGSLLGLGGCAPMLTQKVGSPLVGTVYTPGNQFFGGNGLGGGLR